MKLRHKSHRDIKSVLSLSKKEQDVTFRKLRRKGIFEVNMKETTKESLKYEREISSKNQNDLAYIAANVKALFLEGSRTGILKLSNQIHARK